MLARAEQAVQRVRGEKSGGVLRVGYAPSATAGLLPRVLEQFQKEFSEVRVEMGFRRSSNPLKRTALERFLPTVWSILCPVHWFADPFSPNFEPVVAKVGISSLHPNRHAATFARLLCDAVARPV